MISIECHSFGNGCNRTKFLGANTIQPPINGLTHNLELQGKTDLWPETPRMVLISFEFLKSRTWIFAPSLQDFGWRLWYNWSKNYSSRAANHGWEGLCSKITWVGGIHAEWESEGVYAKFGDHFHGRRESFCPRTTSRAGESTTHHLSQQT